MVQVKPWLLFMALPSRFVGFDGKIVVSTLSLFEASLCDDVITWPRIQQDKNVQHVAIATTSPCILYTTCSRQNCLMETLLVFLIVGQNISFMYHNDLVSDALMALLPPCGQQGDLHLHHRSVSMRRALICCTSIVTLWGGGVRD